MPEDRFTHGLARYGLYACGHAECLCEQLSDLAFSTPSSPTPCERKNDCIAVVLGYLHTPKPEFKDASLAATPPRPRHSPSTAGPSSSPAPKWQHSPANVGTPAPTWQSMYSSDGGHMRSPAEEFSVADDWASGVQGPPLFDIDSLHTPQKYDNEAFDKPASQPTGYEPSAKAAPLSPLPASRDLGFRSDDLGDADFGLGSMPLLSQTQRTPPPKQRMPNIDRPWTAPPSFAAAPDIVSGRAGDLLKGSFPSFARDQPVDSGLSRSYTANAVSASDMYATDLTPEHLREDDASAVHEKPPVRTPLATKTEPFDDDGSSRSFVEELNDSGGLPVRPAMAKVTPDRTLGFEL